MQNSIKRYMNVSWLDILWYHTHTTFPGGDMGHKHKNCEVMPVNLTAQCLLSYSWVGSSPVWAV